MAQDNFLQRKNDVLSKIDKSSKGGWDVHIKSLCEKINEMENYYTTSSCSGRIVIMVDQEKKGKGLFIFVSHEKISFKKLKEVILKMDLSKNIKFKQDPCILHIACGDVESAKELYEKGKSASWKRSGIITFGRNTVVELNSTEKLEFPLVQDGKLLVNDDFLKVIVKKANKKLEKSWKSIEKLRESFS